MLGSTFLPLFAVLLSCLVPGFVVAALTQPSCITFYFGNDNAQSPPTSTVFRSTLTSTSSLPCGSCQLQTQAFFPYPFYGYAAIVSSSVLYDVNVQGCAEHLQEDEFTTTVTSPVGTSTSYVCAPLTSSVSNRNHSPHPQTER